MSEDGELVGTGEAARALGFTRRSLSRWAEQGRLKPARRSPGGRGRFYWNLDDLRRQLVELEQGGHGPDGISDG